MSLPPTFAVWIRIGSMSVQFICTADLHRMLAMVGGGEVVPAFFT
jgi:hypothetical protein